MGAPYNTLIKFNQKNKKKLKIYKKNLIKNKKKNLQFWVGIHGYNRWISNKDWRFS